MHFHFLQTFLPDFQRFIRVRFATRTKCGNRTVIVLTGGGGFYTLSITQSPKNGCQNDHITT